MTALNLSTWDWEAKRKNKNTIPPVLTCNACRYNQPMTKK
jgi:hypothetical protein